MEVIFVISEADISQMLKEVNEERDSGTRKVKFSELDLESLSNSLEEHFDTDIMDVLYDKIFEQVEDVISQEES
jgi:hypothetical protein